MPMSRIGTAGKGDYNFQLGLLQYFVETCVSFHLYLIKLCKNVRLFKFGNKYIYNI